MPSFPRQIVVLGTLLLALTGCSALQPNDESLDWMASGSPVSQRGVKLDPHQIPSYADVRSTVTPPQLSGTSRPLTAAECACLAALRSQLAVVMEKEAAHLRREMTVHHTRGASQVLPAILEDRAKQERNDAAEQALLAYYRLADVHLQQSVLEESQQELGRVRETVQGLREAGLPVQIDPTQLDRQQSQLDLDRAGLMFNEARFTSAVKTLIAEDPLSPEGIDTTCAVEPQPPAFDLPEAMATARQNDFQLRSINRLLQNGDTDDLEVARKLLGLASPLLGQDAGRPGTLAKLSLLWGHDGRGERELSVRQRQLRDMYRARRQQLDLEVANALVTVQQRFLEVSIANDVLASWQRRVSILESNREIQRSEYLDVVAARTDMLKAKSDLLHKMILLEMDHVTLSARLGLLEQQCAAGKLTNDPWQVSPNGPCSITGVTPSELLR